MYSINFMVFGKIYGFGKLFYNFQEIPKRN